MANYPSVGLVLDLTLAASRELTRKVIKNRDAIGAIKKARAQQMRWVVVAGRLYAKAGGCFAICMPVAELLPLAFHAANAFAWSPSTRSTRAFIRPDPDGSPFTTTLVTAVSPVTSSS